VNEAPSTAATPQKLEDCANDAAGIMCTQLYTRDTPASCVPAMGKLADGSAWKTLLAYYQASQLRPFELEDTTFMELRDGGDLRLLGDDELSKGLADYYRNTGAGMVGEILRHNPQYRLQIRGITPYPVQEYIWAHCWKQRQGADQELIDCPSPIAEAQATQIIDNYRKSPGLVENLRFWRAQMHVSVLIVSDVERQARELDKRAIRLMTHG